MCEVLQVTRSGFYAWKKRPESERTVRRNALASAIRSIHSEQYLDVYGSPRMHRELVSRGYAVCENTVAAVMKQAGIQASTEKKFRVTTTDSNHAHPVAENVLDRDFTAEKPGEKLVSDLTYIATDEGFLFLVCVIDVCTRQVVGWSMSHEMTTSVFLSALLMAVQKFDPSTCLLHHSDRGSQYCSEAFQQELARLGIQCSMSRKGNCWDNAVMESFFASLKKEHVYLTRFATREEARQSIFQWIEVFYNRIRLHSTLGYLTPAQFHQES
jgi:transposase InsO family protein